MGRVDDSACGCARGGWGSGGGETARPQLWRHGQDKLVKRASGGAALQPEAAVLGIGYYAAEDPGAKIRAGVVA